MRETTVISLIFIIFGVIICASSKNIPRGRSPSSESVNFMERERLHEENTREDSSHVFNNEGSRSSVNLNSGINSNVKTSQRRSGIAENSERREPGIQAYGLPKRTLESDGIIERIGPDRDSSNNEKSDGVHLRRKESGIQAYGIPKRVVEDNGFIERIGKMENLQGSHGSSSTNIDSVSRRAIRSIDESEKNHLVDLEAQEAKVFRPLFVYRQQVADRYRLKPRKTPIYGAYQYGNKKHKNSIHHGYNKY